MADSPSVLLYVNHVAAGDNMEWSLKTEEILGGAGRATLTVQDRTNSWVPQPHWDVKCVLASGPFAGHVIFRGEIINEPLDLELGLEWRKWVLDCADYTSEFPQRKIGALDGKTWLDTSGFGIFVNVDPYAETLKTDKLTIQNWFDHYIRVDGTAIDTTTFVGEYLTDFLTITPIYSDLRAALEQMAAYVAGNLQFWLDPDLKFHWTLIPNWQELIGSSIAAVDQMALMNPSTPGGLAADLGYAPHEVSGVEGNPGGTIGFHKLKFTFDGSDMPEQVYVRGGTGYVYNAPPIAPIAETLTVVSAPVPGAEGVYQLSTTTSTKLWHTDATGYISLTYDVIGAGGPWPVKFVSVPWNQARNKGGNFWKVLSGPYAGKLISGHTNSLNGYGHIVVELAGTGPGPTPTPKVGTGGSGWVGEITQDPNKRQAFLEAPISVTKTLRDSLGGQALYRGAYPTLRGTVEVTGYDGWRVGTLLKVTDARLPANMNGKFFVIQRVSTELHAETLLRKYNIDFGDGPQSRYSYQSSRRGEVGWPHPANQVVVSAHDLTPGPNESQMITGQLTNSAGEPWNIAGKVVEWRFEAYNAAGVLQVGQGSILPKVAVTDQHGRARTTLLTGPGTNLVYFVFAAVKAV